MSHTNLSHRRTHNILLISWLLNQREGASPFTLVLDSLAQPAKPLLTEYIRRANLSKSHVIFLSFETPRPPSGVDTFVSCWNLSSQQIAQAALSAIGTANKRCLLLIDSLMTLSTRSTQPNPSLDLTAFLMSLLQAPPPSLQPPPALVAVYHTDVLPVNSAKPYSPHPLALLGFLATTIITVNSLADLLADKQARERSLGTPVFGLAEEKEGVVIGLNPQKRSQRPGERGVVLQLEHRRKSGRGVLERYFLPEKAPAKAQNGPAAFKELVSLLDDHPFFKDAEDTPPNVDADLAGVTFELSLTDRQRLERDGVVLPYFDAQKAGGGGQGGRILYDMGAEDDFDEEEDEI